MYISTYNSATFFISSDYIYCLILWIAIVNTKHYLLFVGSYLLTDRERIAVVTMKLERDGANRCRIRISST